MKLGEMFDGQRVDNKLNERTNDKNDSRLVQKVLPVERNKMNFRSSCLERKLGLVELDRIGR